MTVDLVEKLRKTTPAQRRIGLALLVGVLLLAPQLPLLVMAPAAVVATWAAGQPLLVGMVLGALLLHRRRKTGRS